MFESAIEKREYEMRERIFLAASDLLRAYSYSELKVRDICRIAEISKPTFYRYFRDKYEIAEWALFNYARLPMASMAYSSTWEQNLLVTLNHCREHKDFYRKAYAQVDLTFTELNVRAGIELFEQMMYGYHRVKQTDKLDFQFAYTSQMLVRMTRWWLINEMPYPPEVMARYMLEVTPADVRDLVDSHALKHE